MLPVRALQALPLSNSAGILFSAWPAAVGIRDAGVLWQGIQQNLPYSACSNASCSADSLRQWNGTGPACSAHASAQPRCPDIHVVSAGMLCSTSASRTCSIADCGPQVAAGPRWPRQSASLLPQQGGPVVALAALARPPFVRHASSKSGSRCAGAVNMTSPAVAPGPAAAAAGGIAAASRHAAAGNQSVQYLHSTARVSDAEAAHQSHQAYDAATDVSSLLTQLHHFPALQQPQQQPLSISNHQEQLFLLRQQAASGSSSSAPLTPPTAAAAAGASQPAADAPPFTSGMMFPSSSHLLAAKASGSGSSSSSSSRAGILAGSGNSSSSSAGALASSSSSGSGLIGPSAFASFPSSSHMMLRPAANKSSTSGKGAEVSTEPTASAAAAESSNQQTLQGLMQQLQQRRPVATTFSSTSSTSSKPLPPPLQQQQRAVEFIDLRSVLNSLQQRSTPAAASAAAAPPQQQDKQAAVSPAGPAARATSTEFQMRLDKLAALQQQLRQQQQVQARGSVGQVGAQVGSVQARQPAHGSSTSSSSSSSSSGLDIRSLLQSQPVPEQQQLPHSWAGSPGTWQQLESRLAEVQQAPLAAAAETAAAAATPVAEQARLTDLLRDLNVKAPASSSSMQQQQQNAAQPEQPLRPTPANWQQLQQLLLGGLPASQPLSSSHLSGVQASNPQQQQQHEQQAPSLRALLSMQSSKAAEGAMPDNAGLLQLLSEEEAPGRRTLMAEHLQQLMQQQASSEQVQRSKWDLQQQLSQPPASSPAADPALGMHAGASVEQQAAAAAGMEQVPDLRSVLSNLGQQVPDGDGLTGQLLHLVTGKGPAPVSLPQQQSEQVLDRWSYTGSQHQLQEPVSVTAAAEAGAAQQKQQELDARKQLSAAAAATERQMDELFQQLAQQERAQVHAARAGSRKAREEWEDSDSEELSSRVFERGSATGSSSSKKAKAIKVAAAAAAPAKKAKGKAAGASVSAAAADRWAAKLQALQGGGQAGSSAATAEEVLPAEAVPAAAGGLRQVVLPPECTVQQLAGLLDVSQAQLEELLSSLGEAVKSDEDLVSPDVAELAALEHNVVLLVTEPGEGALSQRVPRAPVVTVMGHVDHGKTSLLDALRSSNVAAGEAGGITQHIGAFEVTLPGSGSSITFLDTPGHAAFGAMRARGAAVTDIVVLAVAADDGVMPQTREALAHARAANCPLVVALTKCDLPQADPERVKRQLLAEGVELEEAGGDVQVVETAATAGLGLRELEEALLLQAEVMELAAAASGCPAQGVVVEAQMERGHGAVATIIVKEGALEVGDPVVVGTEYGKVRALRDSRGQTLTSVLPGQHAVIAGLRGLPAAGDELQVVASEERASRISKARSSRAAEYRQVQLARLQHAAEKKQRAAQQLELDRRKRLKERLRQLKREGRSRDATALYRQHLSSTATATASSSSNSSSTAAATAGEQAAGQSAAAEDAAPARIVNFIVKADVQGSVEAVRDAIGALATDVVLPRIVYAAAGAITTSDVNLAATTGAHLVAFNLKPAAGDVEAALKQASVEVISHQVIYHLLDAVGSQLEAAAAAGGAGGGPGGAQELVLGSATVLQLFPQLKKGKEVGQVVGCRVLDGALSLGGGTLYRVVRDGEVVWEGGCASMRRHKEDVSKVEKSQECGLVLGQGSSEVKLEPGDVVQCVSRRAE